MSNVGLRFASTRRATNFCLPRCSNRNIHHLRPLPYSVKGGLGDFLPPAALKTVAVDFQQGLLDRLTTQVKGTEHEHQSVTAIVIQTADKRERSLAFNYASQALNNSFFLEHLKPPVPETDHESSISVDLASAIRHYQGSLGHLKSVFSSAANGMASSGWIWYVTDQLGRTAVMPTFGAGTLLVRSRHHVGPNEWIYVAKPEHELAQKTEPSSQPPPPSEPSVTSPTSGLSNSPNPFSPSIQSRSLHTSSMRSVDFDLNATPSGVYGLNDPTGPSVVTRSSLPLGEGLFPLFCVSMHEHAWMSAGRGVWGKEEYLRQFWKVLDWEKVSETYMNRVGNRTSV